MSKCLNLNCKNEAQPGTSTCKECLGIMVGQSASMLGRLGGKATKKKYGKAHYQKLAANMNKKLGRVKHEE